MNMEKEELNEGDNFFSWLKDAIFTQGLSRKPDHGNMTINPLYFWDKWKKNSRVRKIIDNLKNDIDVITFLKKPESQQMGKWKDLLRSKLGEEDQKLINSISKSQVRTSQEDSKAINENVRMQFLAGLITEEQYKNLL